MLKQENQMKLALVKQQMELEYNSQEMKIHQEQEQALAFLRKEYTDNLDEEEAILEEKKQDALRNLRKKVRRNFFDSFEFNTIICITTACF